MVKVEVVKVEEQKVVVVKVEVTRGGGDGWG